MATINGTVRFECEATGHPEPTVSWLWNDLPIEAGPRHQLLEGGTVLQVGVSLSRWLCWGGTQERADGGGGALFPPKGDCPGLTKVPMGFPTSPQLRAALSAVLPLCRWRWWRRVTPGATRAWLRTRLDQLRSTLPSPCEVRHLPWVTDLLPSSSFSTIWSLLWLWNCMAASVPLCWSCSPCARRSRCHTLRAGERLGCVLPPGEASTSTVMPPLCHSLLGALEQKLPGVCVQTPKTSMALSMAVSHSCVTSNPTRLHRSPGTKMATSCSSMRR